MGSSEVSSRRMEGGHTFTTWESELKMYVLLKAPKLERKNIEFQQNRANVINPIRSNCHSFFE